MNEEDYTVPVEVIGFAGESKTHSKLAIEAAREGRFEEVKEHQERAKEGMLQAHECQTNMLIEEANGNPVPVNIITVHSQDHLTMALMMDELVEEFVNLYQRVSELEKKLERKD